MYPLKQSTAITVPFFAHDANGDGITGKVDGDWTKRISKNGGAFAAMTVTITEMENGWYSFSLSTSHSDTLGILTLSFSATGVKRANLQFRISTRILDDLAFPNTSGRGIDVDADGGVEVDSFQAGAITSAAFAAGAIDNAAIATDAIGAAEFAQAAADKIWSSTTRTLSAFGFTVTVSTNNDKTGYSLSAAGIQAIWDALTSALTTASSIGKLLVDNINATISSRSSHSAADVWASATRTLSTGGNQGVADEVLDRSNSIETGLTLRQALRLIAAACAGKASGLATTTAIYRNAVADSKPRLTATVDSDGNRTAITYDVS